MEEYVRLAIAEEGSVPAPQGLVEIKKSGTDVPVDVKLPEASVPMFVYAEPGWDKQGPYTIQMFYLKAETPAWQLEYPSAEKQEFWHGPYLGELPLLLEPYI